MVQTRLGTRLATDSATVTRFVLFTSIILLDLKLKMECEAEPHLTSRHLAGVLRGVVLRRAQA